MDALFGSASRTTVLVAIGRLGTTYPLELSRVLERLPTEVNRALASLEQTGAVSTRLVGRTRIVELNPRFWAAAELYALLLKLSELPEYERLWKSAGRRRPRAKGKPL
jgi:hypothetical protein